MPRRSDGIVGSGPSRPQSEDKPILTGTAEAIANCLESGEPLECSRPVSQLRDALLAENADSSEGASERCMSLRVGLSIALREQLALRPKLAPLVADGPSPKVRIEVRQTAGRSIVSEAFIVGRIAECDVQTSGDLTVSRLQVLVISLPGCIIVVDPWSSYGTRVVRRTGFTQALPASLPTRRAAFAVAHGERVILLIGARTTVTLGPAAKDATDDVKLPIDFPELVAPVITPKSSEAVTLAQQPPAATDDISNDARRKTIVADGQADAFDLPGAAAPIGASALVGVVSVSEPQPEATSTAAASASALERSGSAAERSPAAVKKCSEKSRWPRCLAAVRATVRMQQAVAVRERLKWRCQVAKRAKLITPEQCTKLEGRLKPAEEGTDEVRDILDGLGVPLAPDEPPPAAPAGATSSAGGWTCSVCNSVQRTRGWSCPFQHRYCVDCMLKWAKARAVPTCPCEGCGYRLAEHDLGDLRVGEERLESFRAARLEEGLAALQADVESQVTLFRCPGPNCNAAVVLGLGEARRRWVCSCGASPACTGCGVSPYHHHGRCSDVQALRARWLAWLHGGRDAYKGLQRRAVRESTAQQRVLREAQARQSELEQDEDWKAENCRLCPSCRKAVAKIDGCNTMVCGQNTHGGNRQPGCGNRFSWRDAHPYRPTSARARPPAGGVQAASVPARAALARVGAVSGRGVRHVFTQCSYCGSGSEGKCIVGPRFRCIHCPSFSSCLKCEERIAEEHEEGHVFEIMFEDEIDWIKIGIELPKNARARIRRQATANYVDAEMEDEAGRPSSSCAGSRKRRRDVDIGLEGVIKGQKRGKYILELPDGLGLRHVEPGDLQPLLTQKQVERLLAALPTSAPGVAVASTVRAGAAAAALNTAADAAAPP